MKYKNLHEWGLSPKEAIRLQRSLRDRIILKKYALKNMHTVAGVDVSVKNDISKAAIVILSYPDLQPLETVTHREKTSFPYVPGLLSFREAPVILKCIAKLETTPDVFVFDGQGLAHPRRTGLAAHMGIIFQKPSIGSAKSHLYGFYDMPGKNKGDFSLIKDQEGQAIGAVLRTRANTNPVFVSPGHLMDIPSSIKIILAISPKYKIPEPVRAAHNAASLSSSKS